MCISTHLKLPILSYIQLNQLPEPSLYFEAILIIAKRNIPMIPLGYFSSNFGIHSRNKKPRPAERIHSLSVEFPHISSNTFGTALQKAPPISCLLLKYPPGYGAGASAYTLRRMWNSGRCPVKISNTFGFFSGVFHMCLG